MYIHTGNVFLHNWAYASRYLLQTQSLPLTEEIGLQIFGSPDYTVFPYYQETLIYSREILFEIFWTPVKTCLKTTGTPVKTRRIFSVGMISSVIMR